MLAAEEPDPFPARVKCLFCRRDFRDDNGMWQHLKAKHGIAEIERMIAAHAIDVEHYREVVRLQRQRIYDLEARIREMEGRRG